jgi:hypothetical protein
MSPQATGVRFLRGLLFIEVYAGEFSFIFTAPEKLIHKGFYSGLFAIIAYSFGEGLPYERT